MEFEKCMHCDNTVAACDHVQMENPVFTAEELLELSASAGHPSLMGEQWKSMIKITSFLIEIQIFAAVVVKLLSMLIRTL